MTGSLRLHLHWLRFAQHISEMNLSTCKLCGSLCKRECSDLVSYPSVLHIHTLLGSLEGSSHLVLDECQSCQFVLALPWPFDLDERQPLLLRNGKLVSLKVLIVVKSKNKFLKIKQAWNTDQVNIALWRALMHLAKSCGLPVNVPHVLHCKFILLSSHISSKHN